MQYGRARSKRDCTCAETRFGLSAKRTSPFKSAGGGGQFSRLLAVEECGSPDRPCSDVQWKAASYPLHSHLSPSLTLPCVTVSHQVPNGLYVVHASVWAPWWVGESRFRTSWVHPKEESCICSMVRVHNLIPTRLLIPMHVKHTIQHIHLSSWGWTHEFRNMYETAIYKIVHFVGLYCIKIKMLLWIELNGARKFVTCGIFWCI